MHIKTLLSILSDGGFHSGEEIGEALGVSRTAIWKQFKKLEELGLPMESVKGKGYQIPGGLDLLDDAEVQIHLSASAKALMSELQIENVVASTNAMAMEKAQAADGKGYVCVAEQQSAGKGRRSRVWQSPYGCNLYLSVVWEFAGGAAALEGLSLAVGVCVVDALQNAGIEGVSLKWPNDVLHEGKKLAGVLLEMTGDAAGPCQLVVGVGLNVAMPVSADKLIDQPWTDVSTIAGERISRNRLLALLLSELMPLLSGFEQKSFAHYRSRWMALDAFADKEVKIKMGQDIILGRAEGVNNSGAIVIQTASGKRSFNGGEVSLRGADDTRV
jgi:BirA family biotin operon repressor/biotin-[acetyl-CoA-carboxylase] ligase